MPSNPIRRAGLALALPLLLLAACAGPGQPREVAGGAPTLGPDDGVVVVSVVTDNPAATPEPLASAEFEIRGPGAGGTSHWLDSRPDGRAGSDFAPETGRLYALVLPAGDYRVGDWRINVPPYSVLGPRTPSAPLPFRVEPGRVRYLGELHMGFVVDRGMMNLPMLSTGRPEVRNSLARDLPVLAARWPGLDPGKVEVAPLDGAILAPAGARTVLPGAATTTAPSPAPASADGYDPPGFTSQPYDPPAPVTDAPLPAPTSTPAAPTSTPAP